MVLVDWVAQKRVGLRGLNIRVELNEGHSDLTSGISATTEAEILNDIVLWVGRVKNLLIISTITVAKVLAWLLIRVKVLGLGLKGSTQLQVGLIQFLLFLSSGSDGSTSGAGETMVLNNIVIMIGLGLKVSVLHSVTVGNLITWLVLLILLNWLRVKDQVSLSIDVCNNL